MRGSRARQDSLADATNDRPGTTAGEGAGAGRAQGAPEDPRGGRRRRIGIAVAAVACGLGVAVAVGLVQAAPSPEAPASAAEAQPAQAAVEADEGMAVADVGAIAKTGLGYAGEDVSPGEEADLEVEADSGHVLVTQRSDDGAEARVEAAAKRSAALMSELSGRSVGGARVSDVTWVMADADGAARVAVRNTPGSAATAAAADPASDASMEAAVGGSDGWAMDDGTHRGLGEGAAVPQSGGTAPTAPDGAEIVAPGDGSEAAGVADGAPTTDDGAGSAEAPGSGQAVADASAASEASSSPQSPSGQAAGWDETVVDTPAWDETVVDTPAWDETVVDIPAWDETVRRTKVVYVVSADGSVWDSVMDASDRALVLDSSCHDETRTYTETVHHDATYRTVHHEAVTHVVHHDAVTRTVHHDS